MNPPSEDIKDILVAESALGLTFGTDLFIGMEPTSPDNCVTIFDTPGGTPDLTLGNDSSYGYPHLQIQIRNRSYPTGWSLAFDIKNCLHGRGPETWNGSLYTVIRCLNEPFLLDRDENNRARFIVNLEAQRR